MSDDPYKAPEDEPVTSGIGLRRGFAIVIAGMALLLAVFIATAFYIFESQQVPPNPGNYFSEQGKSELDADTE